MNPIIPTAWCALNGAATITTRDLTPKSLTYLGVIGFVAVWWYAATLEWRAERVAERILSHEASPYSFKRIPLSAAPQWAAVQRLLASNNPDYAYIDELLAEVVGRRPLYAPYWHARAEAAHGTGNVEEAERYLAKATQLWPTRPILLWKAAMLYVRMGNREAALQALQSYLFAAPGRYRRALAIAARLEPEPAVRLQAVLPDDTAKRQIRDDLAWRILRQARKRDDAVLGHAAWRELSAAARHEVDKAGYYTEWMVALDNREEAVRAWRQIRPQTRLSILENGGFEQELARGLGWRSWDRDGVRLTRDDQMPYAGQYSLKVAFSGTNNTNFYHLRQYLPVEPATAYTLTYAWRGEEITTRSGPYISVRGRQAGRLARGDARWGTWDWERRQLSFTAPEQEHFVEVRLRRNRTDALDNKIAGTLWLDAFSLTPQKSSLSLRERPTLNSFSLRERVRVRGKDSLSPWQRVMAASSWVRSKEEKG